MPRRPLHFVYAVSAQSAEHQFVGFLDMLRYDQARVVESDSSLIVLRSPSPPVSPRWASFGIPVLFETHFPADDIPPTMLVRAEAAPKLPSATRTHTT